MSQTPGGWLPAHRMVVQNSAVFYCASFCSLPGLPHTRESLRLTGAQLQRSTGTCQHSLRMGGVATARLSALHQVSRTHVSLSDPVCPALMTLVA